MAKRQKLVFNNNELAHVWASQSQNEGRGNNMFFEGDSIYSWGFHYKIAKVYNKNIVLVNSRGYSNSTAKHTSHVRHAITHMTNFSVPNVDNPKAEENVTHLANQVANAVTNLLKRIKVWSYDDDKSADLERIKELAVEFNKYCTTFGINDKIILDEEFLAEMTAIFKLKDEKTKELNSAREEKRKAEDAKKETEYLASIESWKKFAGQIKGYSNKVFLRLNKESNEIETSRGAKVPLERAVGLFKAILKGLNVVGETIGHYEVNEVTEETITIGCHNIPMVEAKKLFESMGV